MLAEHSYQALLTSAKHRYRPLRRSIPAMRRYPSLAVTSMHGDTPPVGK